MSRLPLVQLDWFYRTNLTVHPFHWNYVVLLIENLNEAPITSDQIAAWTRKGPTLSKVMQYIMLGWPSQVESE